MAFVWAITKFVNTKQQYDTKMFIARYQLINYSVSVWERSVGIGVSVAVSVCLQASQEHTSGLHQIKCACCL